MYIDTSSQAFARLATLGLISEEHRRAAMAHPRRAAIESDAGLVTHLVWLVDQRIVSHEELDRSHPPGGAPRKPFFDVLTPALNELEERCGALNAGLYEHLLDLKLITLHERRQATAADGIYVWRSAGEALAALVWLNVLAPARFEELVLSIPSQRRQFNGARRIAILRACGSCRWRWRW